MPDVDSHTGEGDSSGIGSHLQTHHDTDIDLDFSGLKATFLNCTLKRSPEMSHTQGLVDVSAAIMRKQGSTSTSSG